MHSISWCTTAMLFCLLFASGCLSLAAGNDCPAYQPTVSCSSSVLVVLDITNKLIPGEATNELNAFKTQVLPHLASNDGQKVGLTYVGGNGYPMPALTSSYDQLCAQFDAISQASQPRNQASLLTLFQSIYTKYGNTIDHLLLYTTDTNINDLDFAGDYSKQMMPNMNISVLAFFGNGNTWESFPYMGIAYISPYNIQNQTVSDCLLGQTCGKITQSCYDLGSHFAAAPPPTTPPSTPNAAVVEQTCSTCTASKVSADVVILIESSIYTGQDGLQKIEAFIKKTFSQFNVETSGSKNAFYMRVGIHYYGDSVQDYKKFGTVTANDLANLKIPLTNDNTTDMADALYHAKDDFDYVEVKRHNVPHIVVVFATDYVASPYYSFPVNAYQEFISSGGKVIVYELDKPGMNGYILKDLTNPAYFIRSSDANADTALISAMCTASCVCPWDTKPYAVDPNTAQPVAGCYYHPIGAANYATASSTCAKRGGYVAEAETAAKSAFMSKMAIGSTFYNGLKWDTTSSSWHWANGKTLSSGYAPWNSGSAHSSNMDCVTITSGQWRQTDCRNGYNYVCQIPPCDQKQAC